MMAVPLPDQASEVSHTALPWAVCEVALNDHWYVGITIFSPWSDGVSGLRVADVCNLNHGYLANAELIVRSVNALPALLGAAKNLCAEMLKAGGESSVDPKAWDAMQNAIAAAEPSL